MRNLRIWIEKWISIWQLVPVLFRVVRSTGLDTIIGRTLVGAFSSKITIYCIPQSWQYAWVWSNIASVSASYQILAEIPCWRNTATKLFRSLNMGFSPTAYTMTSHVFKMTSSASCIVDWMIRSTLMLTPTAPYPSGSSRPREKREISLS